MNAVDKSGSGDRPIRTCPPVLAQLRGPVDLIREMVMVEYADVVHVRNLAQTVLAVSHSPLGLLALGDVANVADVQRLSVRRPDVLADGFDRYQRAIFTAMPA